MTGLAAEEIQSPAVRRGSCFDYLQPAGLLYGGVAVEAAAAGRARWLAGGPLAFTAACLIRRVPGACSGMEPIEARTVLVPELGPECEHILDVLAATRPPFAGLDLSRPRLMGVVNVTPDSFSDGGDLRDAQAAIAHGRALAAAGAEILDIGGESTRPGAVPVSEEEELRRVLPAVRALAADGALVSVDTRRAGVMRAALAAGARIVNDVTALGGDRESLGVIAASGAAVLLMHMQGEPRTMQADPRYAHAPADIYDFLAERVEACSAAGIERERIAIDPGIGFGKTVAHNLQLISDLPLFHGLGCAVAVGVSRKGFIGRLSGEADPKRRLPGSLAAGLAALAGGAQILRVHDVRETRQALAVSEAIRSAA